MKTEYLSDHVRAMLQETTNLHRRAVHDAVFARTNVMAAAARHGTAQRTKPIWRRALSVPSADETEALGEFAQARGLYQTSLEAYGDLDVRLAQLSAGAAGEETLVRALAASLTDQWLLLHGYLSRRGEADVVVVGPAGVWVIEVKNLRVRLSVRGETWRYDKLDSAGNVVESGDATDGSGRSWGRQAADVATALTPWLRAHDVAASVRTAVVLVREGASIQDLENPCVDVVTADMAKLLHEIKKRAGNDLGLDEITRIADLVRQDHQAHNTAVDG
ncbi:MAG: NERD domain-containing protein [Acidimicrobiia bacterium]|nr:NERD domain-containing protein [Acidimicrobiia bacterium]